MAATVVTVLTAAMVAMVANLTDLAMVATVVAMAPAMAATVVAMVAAPSVATVAVPSVDSVATVDPLVSDTESPALLVPRTTVPPERLPPTTPVAASRTDPTLTSMPGPEIRTSPTELSTPRLVPSPTMLSPMMNGRTRMMTSGELRLGDPTRMSTVPPLTARLPPLASLALPTRLVTSTALVLTVTPPAARAAGADMATVALPLTVLRVLATTVATPTTVSRRVPPSGTVLPRVATTTMPGRREPTALTPTPDGASLTIPLLPSLTPTSLTTAQSLLMTTSGLRTRTNGLPPTTGIRMPPPPTRRRISVPPLAPRPKAERAGDGPETVPPSRVLRMRATVLPLPPSTAATWTGPRVALTPMPTAEIRITPSTSTTMTPAPSPTVPSPTMSGTTPTMTPGVLSLGAAIRTSTDLPLRTMVLHPGSRLVTTAMAPDTVLTAMVPTNPLLPPTVTAGVRAVTADGATVAHLLSSTVTRVTVLSMALRTTVLPRVPPVNGRPPRVATTTTPGPRVLTALTTTPDTESLTMPSTPSPTTNRTPSATPRLMMTDELLKPGVELTPLPSPSTTTGELFDQTMAC